LPYPFEYINDFEKTLSIRDRGTTVEELLDLDTLSLALQARAASVVTKTIEAYNASTATAKVKDNELFAQARVIMCRAHLLFVQFHMFRTSVAQLQARDAKIKQHLELLVKVFALNILIKDGAAAFDAGFFAKGALHNLTKAMAHAIETLRPQMIPLAETMYLPDHLIPSSIGNEFGDIYEK